MKKIYLPIITVCVLGFFGCSDLKNENPAAISTSVGVHQDGMVSPTSANFHGKLIAAQNGNTKECTKCHGADFNGGSSNKSCNACHTQTHTGGTAASTDATFHGKIIAARNGDMTACTKCHGADYNGGQLGKSCNACHKHAPGIVTPSSANFHGKIIAAKNWSMTTCKSCHGATYAGTALGKTCLTCHSKPSGPENCTTCHGDTTPAPPKDLAGNTATTARGVGAHQVHLNGGGSLGAIALTCANCHVVPGALASAGHIDSTPYATVQFNSTGNLAFTKTNVVGTQNYASTLPTITPAPSYSSATIKCSDTYCHGNFKNGNTTYAIAWNAPSDDAIACGTCHGDVTKATLADRALPKTAANGGTHFPMTACSGCHADVVDANMKIIAPSKHINGKLNIFGQEIAF